MKIGFNLFKCVGDILDDKVDIKDVLYIISSTAIKEERSIDGAVLNYLGGKPDTIRAIRMIGVLGQLMKENKLIQPRLQGMNEHYVPEHHWADIFFDDGNDNTTVKRAWENYKIASVLSKDHA